MLKLYYAPDNASLILRLALEEAGAAYQTVLVDRSKRAQKDPDYLALNPAGRIPVLVTPQGALFETGACLLWLCDTYPEAGLSPRAGAPQRGIFLSWLFYLANTPHADLVRLFYPTRSIPADAIEQHHDKLAGQLQGQFAILDDAVRDHPQLFAAGSALSLYLCALMRWAALYPAAGRRWFDLDSYPRLKAMALAVEDRPSARTTAQAEGLGRLPFSNPSPPRPPEGSAT